MRRGAMIVTGAMLAATFAASLAGSPAVAEVGVAAAVNPDARRTPPGAATRTVVLGDTLIFRERIETRGDGLVQILLVDGSTFTVGANSDLVIDEFVYDPDAGTGRLVASFGKGVARFVGGRLSKSEGGVTVNTPVGTIGIRGGIANLSVEGGEAAFSLLFGDELTFTGPDGSRERVYERGYTLSVRDGGQAGPQRTIRRTTQADLGGVQRRLAGRAGLSGGARTPPTDTRVARSGVVPVNSARPTVAVAPRPKPQAVRSSTLREGGEVLQKIAARANAEIVRETSEPAEASEPPETPPEAGSPINVRVLSSGESYTAAFDVAAIPDPGRHGLIGGGPAQDRTVVFNVDASRTQMTGTVDGETLTIPLPASGEAAFRVVTDAGRAVAGTVHIAGDHFIAFTYFEEISASVLAVNDPVFGLWGQASDVATVEAENPDQIRRYHLAADPLQKARNGFGHDLYFLNPFAADLLGESFLSGVRTSDFLLVANDDLSENDPRYLVASMLISGEGTDQSSAISVSTGVVFTNAYGDFEIGGARRGGFRAEATDPGVLYSGPVSSLPGADGGHVFGPDAENFVLSFDPGASDLARDSSVAGPAPYASDAERSSGFVHVGSLANEADVGAFSRTTRVLNGYGAAMMETQTTGGVPVPLWSATPNDLLMSFNAEINTVGAALTVYDQTAEDPGLAALRVGFGQGLFSGQNGASALIDDDRYALTHNRAETFAISDAAATIAPEGNPRSYMVPSTLVAGADNALFGSASRCTCAFLEWGYWGTRFEGDGGTGPFDARDDYVHLGTWAAGDIVANADLPTAGSATFSGHAVGNVARQVADGTAQYLAAGDFGMTYDFASRLGTATISGFDGRDFGASVAGVPGGASDLNRFGGALTETSAGGASGVLTGSFARGPAGPAQGVVGSFGVADPTGAWRATGIVVGQQGGVPD